jgi:hypothetical protein
VFYEGGFYLRWSKKAPLIPLAGTHWLCLVAL